MGAAQSASEICLLNDAGDICAFSLRDNAVRIVIVMASCNPNAKFDHLRTQFVSRSCRATEVGVPALGPRKTPIQLTGWL